jgi:hypothetical protein
MEQNELFSTLKIVICRTCSFQNVTQFSQGNNMLYIPASKIYSFLLRDRSVSSTHLNRPIWNKRGYLHLENPWLQKYSLDKLAEFSKEFSVLDVPASDTNCFLLRDTCASSTQLNRPIWNKRGYLHLETPQLQEVFLRKIYSIFKGKQCARCSCF